MCDFYASFKYSGYGGIQLGFGHLDNASLFSLTFNMAWTIKFRLNCLV